MDEKFNTIHPLVCCKFHKNPPNSLDGCVGPTTYWSTDQQTNIIDKLNHHDHHVGFNFCQSRCLICILLPSTTNVRQNETFLVMYFVILLVLSTKLGDIYPKVPALSLKLKATHTVVDFKTPTFIIYTSPRSVSASLHVSVRQLSPPPTEATVNVSESPL